MENIIEKISSEIEDQNSEVVLYKIACYPADYTLRGLYDKWKKGEIEIPGFQRGFVWTISQASKLIESFLLGLPVPQIFFYREVESQVLLVIDGQQRLKTIFSYFDNMWPDSDKQFSLKDINKKWVGQNYDELDSADKIRLNDSVLRAVIVEQKDPKDCTSIYHIFERLNTLGTPLKLQEVRNCVYQGKFNDLLKKINVDEKFRKIIGIPKPDKRMRDIELILRFFSLCYEYKKYTKPMKDFLSDFMCRYKNKTDMLQEFELLFLETVPLVHKFLGSNLFRIKAGLNAAIFDSVMVAFALNRKNIPRDIKLRYKNLLKKSSFLNCVSDHTTDEKIIEKRINTAIKTLFK
jgi:uncharacterized protein with ParB-like and HNH nuclease domain